MAAYACQLESYNSRWILGDELGMAAAAPRETRPNAMMKAFGSMVLSQCEEMPVLGTRLLLRSKRDSGKENTVERLIEGLD